MNLFDYIKGAIPPFWRKSRLIAWIKALISPVQTLTDDFVQFKADKKYDVSFNGQVIYLEHLLNDRFDDTQRRIYITDSTTQIIAPFVYNKVEQKEIYIYNKSESTPFFLFGKNEYLTGTDFIVHVPTALLTPSVEIILVALVKRYKIAGKRFEVKTF